MEVKVRIVGSKVKQGSWPELKLEELKGVGDKVGFKGQRLQVRCEVKVVGSKDQR